MKVLTAEAQEDRDDFEMHLREYGGCTCFINPPCGHCTHPGNPLNQEDDSCWEEVNEDNGWMPDMLNDEVDVMAVTEDLVAVEVGK